MKRILTQVTQKPHNRCKIQFHNESQNWVMQWAGKHPDKSVTFVSHAEQYKIQLVFFWDAHFVAEIKLQ